MLLNLTSAVTCTLGFKVPKMTFYHGGTSEIHRHIYTTLSELGKPCILYCSCLVTYSRTD